MAKHVKQTGGARYGIRVKFQQTEAPEAGAIQANGRILPAAIVRQSQSFGAGTADYN
jgi:tetrahydrodipicolinate N-succinyltransferase